MTSNGTAVVIAAARGGRQRLLAAVAALAFGLFGALVPVASASASSQVTVHLVDQANTSVVGLNVIVRDGLTVVAGPVASDINGDVVLALPAGGYHLYVDDGSVDAAGNSYGQAYAAVSVSGADQTLPDLTVNRYVDISGVIDNWSPAMAGGVEVQLWFDNAPGANWVGSSVSVVTTTANFSLPAVIVDQPYTLRFTMHDDNTPYLDAFLGGALGDAALATPLAVTPGVGVSGLTMTMPDAVAVTGTVTTGGRTPLAGILVSAVDQPDENQNFETTTDALGRYTLYVRPGLIYAVHADDTSAIPGGPYASMTYDGFDGCGCDFTPVAPTGVPVGGIDFDLLLKSSALEILGVVADSSSNADGINVRLFRASGSDWVLDDVVVSHSTIASPWNFGFLPASPAHYRLQFATAGGVIIHVVDGGASPISGPPFPFDPVPACYADLGTVSSDLAAEALVDLSTVAGSCASLDAPAAPGTPTPTTDSGSFTPRSVSPAVVRALTAAKVASTKATPTPSPTPSSPTPRPSSSPTPAAADKPASGPGLWWLVWVIFGIVVIAIIGGFVFLVRRQL